MNNLYKKLKPDCMDLYEHFPTLEILSSECESVVEMGVRGVCSGWALATGLSKNNKDIKRLVYLDIEDCKNIKFEEACDKLKIDITWVHSNSLDYNINPSCDLLMIDTLHTYKQLYSELCKHSVNVNKFIIMHDTEAPWGYSNERNDGSAKNGLKVAVTDFLDSNIDVWRLKGHYVNQHGLTILERINGTS